jgi:hypothetical protein
VTSRAPDYRFSCCTPPGGWQIQRPRRGRKQRSTSGARLD